MKKKLAAPAAFTLVELLVVILIISILLVALIPAVNSISKSSGRKAAVSLVLSTIEQARTQAIKDSRATYVVFAAQPINSSSSSITDGTLLDRYFYHSAAIFQDDPTDITKPKVQLSPWKIFPTGIYLRTEISFSAPTPPATTANNAVWVSDVHFNFAPASLAARDQIFPYMKFDESGSLVAPTPLNPGSILLRLFEGYVTGTNEHPTNAKNRDEVISVAAVTGRATYVP